MKSLVDDVKELLKLKDIKKQLEKEKDSVLKEIKSKEVEVLKRFEEEGIQSIDLPEYGKAFRVATSFPRIANINTFKKYLEDNKYNLLFTERVHPQTLRGFVNERIDQDGVVPDGIEIWTRVEVRKK